MKTEAEPEVRYLVDHMNASDLLGPGAPPGQWNAFQADPGWAFTDLRFRTIAPGVQFEGSVAGVVPANARAQVGTLPEGYRPRIALRMAGVSGMGLTIGFAMFEINQQGQVYVQGSVGDGTQTVFLSLQTVFGLD